MAMPQRVDAIVVGAGFGGLAAARSLVDAGARVALVEATRRAGGRARTVHPRWAGGVPVEAGPEFVDGQHELVRRACAETGVTLRPVRGGALVFDGERLVPAESLSGAADRRLHERYEAVVDAIVDGLPDADCPERHPEAARWDAQSVAQLVEACEHEVGEAPRARRQLLRFTQGMLGAQADRVSALFLAQQFALFRDGASARVDEGLGTVAARTLDALRTRGVDVRLAAPATGLSWDDTTVEVRLRDGAMLTAAGIVLAVPLPALARLDAHGSLPAPWRRAAAELAYGSLVKTSVPADGAEVPGWAVFSDRPSGLVWQPRPEILTTYAGGDLAESTVDQPATEVVASTAADAGAALGRSLRPVGTTWRWSSRTRRGGCYVVFGPGQVTAYWAALRARIGPLTLAGEHCGRSCGYVEGAMEAGVRAAAQLLEVSPRTPG